MKRLSSCYLKKALILKLKIRSMAKRRYLGHLKTGMKRLSSCYLKKALILKLEIIMAKRRYL
ncbi:hypothetical protein HD806DRAFT_513017 [Xylariaceae sp. AK1471]|nr:hypothetical protein HD806DRAFT_513017 [Xylariaceae sp. AK1471]